MPIYVYTREVTRPGSQYTQAFLKYLGRDFLSGEWLVADRAAPSDNVKVSVEGAETEAQISSVLDQITPYCFVGASDKPVGPDGIPEAQGDGADVHTVTIWKKNYWTKDTVPGSEVVRILPNQMIGVNPRMVQLVDGVGRVSVGPSTMSGVIQMELRDQAGDVMSGYLTVRFL
jgi:hypothetical protein